MNPFKRFLQRLTSSQSKNAGEEEDGSRGWHIGDQRQTNNLNEIRICQGHSDIVRHLIQVDESRCASASDDGSVIIWNAISGEKIHQLKGHSLCVTCMLVIAPDVLATGSADRTVRLWNLQTGECTKVMKDFHQGSVKCLVNIDSKGWFCSGGNDRFLFIWDTAGELQGKIERQEEENDRFASGSLDGSILVWHAAQDILPMFRLNFPDQYINSDHVYMYSVNALLKIGDHYLAACIGNGYRVYDTRNGDCVMECINAHNANVLSIISLYYDTILVTSSADTSIRMWSARQGLNFSSPTPQPPPGGDVASSLHATGLNSPSKHGAGSSSKESPSKSKISLSRSSPDVPKDFKDGNGPGGRLRRTVLNPLLVGEMWAHSDQVNTLLPLSPFAFASGSYDSSVIMWYDGRLEAEKRCEVALAHLLHFKAQCEWNEQLMAAAAAGGTTDSDEEDDSHLRRDAQYDLFTGNEGGTRLADVIQSAQHPQQHHHRSRRGRASTVTGASRSRAIMRESSADESATNTDEDSGMHTPTKQATESTKFRVFGSRQSAIAEESSPSEHDGEPGPLPQLKSPEPRPLVSTRTRSADNLHSLIMTSPTATASTLRLGMSPIETTTTTTPSRHMAHAPSAPNLAHVRVPDYIFDNAVFMLREQEMSLDQIREELRSSGMSEAIIEATILKLQEL